MRAGLPGPEFVGLGVQKPGPAPPLGKTCCPPESHFLTPHFLSPPSSPGALEHLLSKVENLDLTLVSSVQHDFLFLPLLSLFVHGNLLAKPNS